MEMLSIDLYTFRGISIYNCQLFLSYKYSAHTKVMFFFSSRKNKLNIGGRDTVKIEFHSSDTFVYFSEWNHGKCPTTPLQGEGMLTFINIPVFVI